MIAPPIALAKKTVSAYVRYRDAAAHRISESSQAVLFEKAQDLFKQLVLKMQCTPSEELMVSENLSHLVANTPPSKRHPKVH